MFESSCSFDDFYTFFVVVAAVQDALKKNWKHSKAIKGDANPMPNSGDQHSVDDREEESALLYINRKTNAHWENY